MIDHLALATSKDTKGAALLAGQTLAIAGSPGGSAVAGLNQGPACGRFIHLRIAIFISVIAGLAGGWHHFSHASPAKDASGTGLHTRLTKPNPQRASRPRVTRLRDPLVGVAITVVVNVVAGLGRGFRGSYADKDAQGTHRAASVEAGACFHPEWSIVAGQGCIDWGIIGDAVAVVVDQVAHFDTTIGGRARIFTTVGRKTIDVVKVRIAVGCRIERTSADCARRRRIGKAANSAALSTVIDVAVGVEVFVDASIAIVID